MSTRREQGPETERTETQDGLDGGEGESYVAEVMGDESQSATESGMDESSVSEMSESEDDGRWGFLTKTRKKLDGFAQAFAASWRNKGDASDSCGDDDDDLPAEMAVDHDHVKDKEHRIADHQARLKRRASVTAQHFLEFAPRAKMTRCVSAPVWLVGSDELMVARDKALMEVEQDKVRKKKVFKRSHSSPSLLLSTLHVRFKAHLPDVRKPSLNVPGFASSTSGQAPRPSVVAASAQSGRARGFGKATSSPSMSKAMIGRDRAVTANTTANGARVQSRGMARARVPISRTTSSPARLSPLSQIAVVVEARQTKDPTWLQEVRLRRDSDIGPQVAPNGDGNARSRAQSGATSSKRRLGFAKTLSTPTIDRTGLPPLGRRSVSPHLPPAGTTPDKSTDTSSKGAPVVPPAVTLPPPLSPGTRARARGRPKRASLEEARLARAVSSPLPVVSEWMERLFAGQKAKAAANNKDNNNARIGQSGAHSPGLQSPLRQSSGSESEAFDDSSGDHTNSAPSPMVQASQQSSATEVTASPRSSSGQPSRFASGELAELSSPEVSSIEGSPNVTGRSYRERARQSATQYRSAVHEHPPGMDPSLAYPAEIEWELDPTTGQLTPAEQFESRKMAVLYCVFTAGILETHVNGPCDSLALYQWISDMQVALELPCSVILLSLIYVERLHSRQSHLEFSESALRGLFLMAMLTGSKYAEDETYPNRAWSNLTNGQFDIGMFNDMEHEFLFLLGWSVHVTEQEYEEYRSFAIRGDEGAQEWKEALAMMNDSLDEGQEYDDAVYDTPEGKQVDTGAPPGIARPPGLPLELQHEP